MYSYRCIITFQVVHVKEFYYVVKNCVTQLTLLELKKKSLITTTYLTVMKLKTRPSYFPGGGGGLASWDFINYGPIPRINWIGN